MDSHLLTASIRIDWFSLPIHSFLELMPTLRAGWLKGVFQIKASTPWAGNRSERLQVSMRLPNDRDLDTWYDSVYGLPITWPDISDLGKEYQKQVVMADLRELGKQLDVVHMWGTVHPRWNLLKFHLFNFGPSPMSARDLANQLVNRSSRPGEDFKEKVCPYATQARWNAWRRAKHEVKSLCRHRTPLQFPSEQIVADYAL